MSESNGGTGRLPNLTLQEERLRREWTQQELADRVGTTVVNVSRWERGATSPNPYFRQKLCEVFEKDASELGLFSVRQTSQSETELIFEDIIPNLPEEELATTTHQSTSLSLRQHFFGRRRTVVTLISSALAILIAGDGLLIFRLVRPQPLAPGTLIAQDTFHRPNQIHWGTASDGQKWMGDANVWPNFSVVNNTAQIAITSSEKVYSAVLGGKVSNAEVLFRGSVNNSSLINDFETSNLGAVLRWTDAKNWYKAYIEGDNLVIQRNVRGTTTVLAKVPFEARVGISYTMRFRAVGTNLMAKVWLTASSEPSQWTATVNDSSFSSGFCGLRSQVVGDITTTVISFRATAV